MGLGECHVSLGKGLASGHIMVRWSLEVQVNKSQVKVKSQSELDIVGHETCCS